MLNSLDPQLIDHPEKASKQYKELVRERYLITKNTNTSYIETGDITPLERRYIFEFIMDELQKQKEAYDKIKQENSGRR